MYTLSTFLSLKGSSLLDGLDSLLCSIIKVLCWDDRQAACPEDLLSALHVGALWCDSNPSFVSDLSAAVSRCSADDLDIYTAFRRKCR